MKVWIREATLDDFEAIARLHAQSWRTAYRGMFRDEFLDGDILSDRRRVWHERLYAPAKNQWVWMAESDGRIDGFVCAFGGHDGRWGTLIDNLHVREEARRRGLGRSLFMEVVRRAQLRYPGCGLYLWVLDGNAPARRFYERLGAREYESVPWEPPGGGVVTNIRCGWPYLRPWLSPPTN